MTDNTLAAAGAPAENEAPDHVETPDIDTPETGATDSAQDSADADKNGDSADKSIKRLERRISRVTAARYQAEAEAAHLRERLAAIERQSAQPAEEGPQDIERLVTERAREMTTVQQVTARANSIADAGKAAYGDAFLDSVNAVAEEAGPLFAPNGMPTALGEAVMDADKPAALLHYLSQRPDIAETLAGKSPAAIGRRIAQIEADMNTKAAPNPSKAPQPLQAPRGSSTPSSPTPGTPEFMAWKLKQLGG